ncbi:MAG: hypothetical protein ACU84Q_04115 [Gammaproteobacteria bacterium]
MGSDSQQLSNLEPKRLIGKHCHDMLIHERWMFGERHNECEAIYLRADEDQWFVLLADEDTATWVLRQSNEERARHVGHDGDSHYRFRDAAKDFKLTGLRVDNVNTKKLGDKIELCLEFSNATDLTVHFNLNTGESSLYFIKD